MAYAYGVYVQRKNKSLLKKTLDFHQFFFGHETQKAEQAGPLAGNTVNLLPLFHVKHPPDARIRRVFL